MTASASAYEYYLIKKRLNNLLAHDALEIHKKRPDYIYIKYSIYRESMTELLTEEQRKGQWGINVLIQPLGKWWKTFKHSVAWRLLTIAKTGDSHERWKAVQQLARISHLKDWDYQHLAQICDARTAISLARQKCDQRWFVQPPGHTLVRQPKSLITEMRQLFELLKPTHRQCIKHFRVAAFNRFAILHGYVDDRSVQPFDRCIISKQEFDCLRQFLEVFVHLTRHVDASRILIRAGCLQTLYELQKMFHYNNEMRYMLAKVMANLSMCKEAGDDFFVTGWVGALAIWSRDTDLRVQMTSAKALANMDAEETKGYVYHHNVYPLYPVGRTQHQHDVDIVFVHGLLGEESRTNGRMQKY